VNFRLAHRSNGWLCGLVLLIVSVGALVGLAAEEQSPSPQESTNPKPNAGEENFEKQVRPLFNQYCLRCHDADEMEAGIRVDRLEGGLPDGQLFLWQGILDQLSQETMPPEGEPQPTAQERERWSGWIRDALKQARLREETYDGAVRRLTVTQYRNTLRDLLGLDDDLTGVLPPDSRSKGGFVNDEQTMLLSPLLLEAYFEIAEQALDRCIVDPDAKPVVQNFRMDLGRGINPEPYADKLILGANSLLLENQDFLVTETRPQKPFEFTPFAMQRKFRFIEGYQGNDTVRGWREFDSIYHNVFACMRGTVGYPKGEAYHTIPAGLLLRPAIPSPELFGVSSTYGPNANFKVSLRELPDAGNFRVTVQAARYDDGLLLDPKVVAPEENKTIAICAFDFTDAETATVQIEQAGVYRLDVEYVAGEKPELFALQLGEREFSGKLPPLGGKPQDPAAPQQAAFLVVRLPEGALPVRGQYADNARLRRLDFHRLADDDPLAKRFAAFEKRTPYLGVHVGLRRDCGSTLSPVGVPQTVRSRDLETFVFEGAINNFPSPDVEPDNVNYLAGFREIGVRSEHTDGRDMPRLLIRSIEFEGPYYAMWPPETHRRIFIASDQRNDPPRYAREIIQSFATRAFRRPATAEEIDALATVWENSYQQTGDFRQSVKDALLVALTSPQFLFLIEKSESPAAEELDAYELASKLSYFLWNMPPDEQLLAQAATGSLRTSLNAEIDRMMADERFEEFVEEFTSQWMRLDKLDVVETDRKRFPGLTRTIKAQLRQEPTQTLLHLIRGNQPVRRLIQDDQIMANDVVANYYGLADRTESGFEFQPIAHHDEHLGGLLSQAGILAGLSDGREANPVKRGAWFARKIIARPPADPPPNVPQLMQDDGMKLTLREKLELHRNQKGCAKCHSGIDPWGLPFEQFGADGRFQTGANVDAQSTLPDGTDVQDLNGLKNYLAHEQIERVAFSFMRHIAEYAVGRRLTYRELEFLQQQSIELKSRDFPLQDMIRLVIHSDIFLKK